MRMYTLICHLSPKLYWVTLNITFTGSADGIFTIVTIMVLFLEHLEIPD